MHDIMRPLASVSKETKSGWLRTFIIGAIGVVAVIAFVVIPLVFVKGLQIAKLKSGGQGGMPPTTVTSAEVKQENWPPLLSAIGSVSAVQGAMISSELPGTVAEVGFESGDGEERRFAGEV
jgi:membrane fusion protein (multidrug efflux system)